MAWVVVAIALALAWSNGGNDNFKGVATLYGSGTTSYRKALAWATVTTLLGSLLALLLARGLVNAFSAKGLVPDAVAADPRFLGAAALAAALTVLAATRFGMPVSTTHALTGALVGAGCASGAVVNLGVLGKGFVLPLLLSPVLAAVAVLALYPAARAARRGLGIERTSCVCVGSELVPLEQAAGGALVAARSDLSVTVGNEASCVTRYQGALVGVTAQGAVDVAHFLSAGLVCFARALNDTPKIVGVLVGAHAVGADAGLTGVGVAMAIGGLFGARRVAETMAKKITPLEAGPGLVANVTTAALVIAASRLSLPVSTTHVATGGIFGIGIVSGKARWRTVLTILAAWISTVPVGLALGAAAMLALRFAIR